MGDDEQRVYVEEVRRYYDRETPAYVADLGRTLQAGRYERARAAGADAYRDSNLALAERAGIRAGERILDAGCGVAGPAVDIATAYAGLRIDAITISPVQAALAREHVRGAGVENRVSIHTGDYHALPFEDARFDRVVFFESSGYSYDPDRLFAEVRRVLRPGGTLYVKDVFRDETCSTGDALRELAEFNDVYRYRTRPLAEVAACVAAAGFSPVRTFVFTGEIATSAFDEAMVRTSPETGETVLTGLGEHHFRPFRTLPIVFAEIVAVRS